MYSKLCILRKLFHSYLRINITEKFGCSTSTGRHTVLDMTSTQPHVTVNKTAIRKNKILGQYLITKTDTKAQSILIEEWPFAVGTKCNGPVVCLECYKPVNFNDAKNRCIHCGWPLCEKCSKDRAAYHRERECLIFSATRQKFYYEKRFDYGCPQLDCIMSLRVLLAKEQQPERWETEIEPMEYHNDARRNQTEIWQADLINIAQYLRGPCKLKDRFSEELIMRVVGILEVNAFEARTTQGYPLRCLYPVTGILAHNCVPNTARFIFPSDGFKIQLRAMRDLNAGQQLHHSYTYTLDGTFERQEHLKAGKYFSCECERCKDPTELDIHFSTFKCTKCENGWLLSSNPLDSKADWKCNKCEFKTSNNAIQKAVSVMQAELSVIQSMKLGSDRLEETEKLMRKFESVVHPLHFILTSMRQNLIEMYGRVEGYEMVSLPDILLERKVELCQQVLRVLNVFESGLSRSRALMLYEVHVPLVLLAKSAFIAGALTTEALKVKLRAAIAILQECVKILQYEDPNSQEGNLGKVAKDAFEQLNASLASLGSE